MWSTEAYEVGLLAAGILRGQEGLFLGDEGLEPGLGLPLPGDRAFDLADIAAATTLPQPFNGLLSLKSSGAEFRV